MEVKDGGKNMYDTLFETNHAHSRMNSSMSALECDHLVLSYRVRIDHWAWHQIVKAGQAKEVS